MTGNERPADGRSRSINRPVIVELRLMPEEARSLADLADRINAKRGTKDLVRQHGLEELIRGCRRAIARPGSFAAVESTNHERTGP